MIKHLIYTLGWTAMVIGLAWTIVHIAKAIENDTKQEYEICQIDKCVLIWDLREGANCIIGTNIQGGNIEICGTFTKVKMGHL